MYFKTTRPVLTEIGILHTALLQVHSTVITDPHILLTSWDWTEIHIDND